MAMPTWVNRRLDSIEREIDEIRRRFDEKKKPAKKNVYGILKGRRYEIDELKQAGNEFVAGRRNASK